jgi:hypothetical protein
VTDDSNRHPAIPSIPFSERALAHKAYWHVVCMSRQNLLGVDMAEVTAARLATIVAAERAVAVALAGPPRAFLEDADDENLERMSAYLATCRAELEARR